MSAVAQNIFFQKRLAKTKYCAIVSKKGCEEKSKRLDMLQKELPNMVSELRTEAFMPRLRRVHPLQ